ncbi:MAG: signal peptide peptidase SppA [Moraxella sp.]|nr:signal peptide peptidase SppA [Moraxella sp.]
MAWPPNPNKQPEQNHSSNNDGQLPPPKSGQEWRLLEKTLLATIDEQRKARRWSVFFKILTFLYLLFIVVSLGRGCSPVDKTGRALQITEPHLAVIDVQGVIASDSPVNSIDISRALTDAFENDNAKAVALNINSPGGSPVQSDEIWQTAMELRKEYPDKKLYAVIGDMGASGAYYIAASADEIWVNPSSLVGSIGVIMSSYNIEGLMDKVGVKDNTMTSGEYKDILSMSRPMTADERAYIDNMMAIIHQNFIDAVVEGRGDKLKDPEANKLFTGLFWSGKQAIELGLADKAGSVSTLKKSLALETAVNYTPQDPMQKLLDRFGVQVGKGVGASFGENVLQSANEEAVKLR